MSDIRRLPVLSLTDAVVLPGMVVPIELDEPAQAAIDAARAAAASGDDSADRDDRADGDDRDDSIGELLIAPRLQDRYAAYGVVATIEQVGRMAGGAPAAVLRAHRRARIGTGVSGPEQRCGCRPRSSTTSPSPIGRKSLPPNTSRW